MKAATTSFNELFSVRTGAIGLRQRLVFVNTLLFFFFLPISVTGAQLMLGLGLLLVLPDMFSRPHLFTDKAIVLPLALFTILSLLAIVFSTNPSASLTSARHLLLLLVVPYTVYAVSDMSQIRPHLLALFAGALLSGGYGAYQVITGTAGGSYGYRLTSTLGHYMTAGGVFMLICLAALAVGFFAVRRMPRTAFMTIAVICAGIVVLTQSRNAYIGLICGLLALCVVWRNKLVFILPFVLALLVLLSPPMVREGMYDVVDINHTSTQSRIWMVETGFNIMADFPLFGIGLGQIQTFYDHYNPPGTPGGYPHLHNNLVEIAAERGLPAMLAWIWLIYILGKQAFLISQRERHSLWRRGLGAAAFAGVVALVCAGMFERNWGDAEVRMLFLALASLPFAAGYTGADEEEEDES